MLRVALIGTGFIAKHHAEGWSKVPGAKITGLCSPSGRGFDGRFGAEGNLGTEGFTLDVSGITCTKNAYELLGVGFDVIDICTPTPSHGQLVTAALDAGKHVICEKPLTLDAGEAARLKQAAARAKGFAMAAHCMRFWPGWLEPMAWMKARAFGVPHAARFSRVTDAPNWSPVFLDGKAVGGTKGDLMIHDIDFALEMFGMPRNVFARGSNVVSSDGAIDEVTALLGYSEGFYVTIESSWMRNKALGFEAKFEIRCADATVTGGFAAPGLQIHGAEVPKVDLPFQYGQATGWEGQLRYFADCIARDQPPEAGTFTQAGRALAVSDAIGLSIRENRLVQC